MIMRMTWGKLRPGSWKEFEKTYNATVATKGVTSRGFAGDGSCKMRRIRTPALQ